MKSTSPRLRPHFSFLMRPQLAATPLEIDDQPRRLCVAALAKRHRVPLREAEQLGHALHINDVVGVDVVAHCDGTLQRLTFRAKCPSRRID